MKRILLFIVILESVYFFSSCEKEFNFTSEKVLYLSKIKLNGALSSEYFYDDNKLVQRIDNYDTLGVLTSYYIYEYTNSNKLFKTHIFDGTGKSNGLYIYEYNENDCVSKSSHYLSDTSSTLVRHTDYEYDQLNQCIQSVTWNDINHSILFITSNEYANWSRVKSSILSISSLAEITLNYTFDNKINPNKYLSNTFISYSLHNTLSFSSPDIISQGGTIDEEGQVWFSFSYDNQMVFLFSTSTYLYNKEGYPIKQTRTLNYKPSKVEVRVYEYIQ